MIMITVSITLDKISLKKIKCDKYGLIFSMSLSKVSVDIAKVVSMHLIILENPKERKLFSQMFAGIDKKKIF